MSYATSQFSLDPNSKKGNLGDFQHGREVFTRKNLELAPKTKFLYHVNFNFNPFAISSLGIDRELLSVLVKTAELPKFNIQTDTLNQYNRKKITQVKVDYQPVTIKFHDDNSNVVRDLWEYYFLYHYSDSAMAKFDPVRIAAFSRNAMDDITGKPALLYRYGYDTGNLFRFFNSIEIFQMSRQEWSKYVLVNPVILTWNHDTLDYSSSSPAEQTMTIGYEAVGYDKGSGNPEGFPTSKYDKVNSPITLGSSGAQGGAEQLFDQTPTALSTSQPRDLNTQLQQVNSFQNVNNNLSSGLSESSLNSTISGTLNNLNTLDPTNPLNVSFNVKEEPPKTQAIQFQI